MPAKRTYLVYYAVAILIWGTESVLTKAFLLDRSRRRPCWCCALRSQHWFCFRLFCWTAPSLMD